MNEVDYLAVAEENAMFWVEQHTAVIQRSSNPVGQSYNELSLRYHLLGIVRLLRDGDQLAFADFLRRSGRANLELRSRVATSGGLIHPAYLQASDAMPWSDALVAGDLDTARAIAKLAPSAHVQGFEYEDDFLRFHVLHRLLLEPTEGESLAAILFRWEQVTEGAPCVYRDVSTALLNRDSEAFDEAIEGVIERRRETLAWYRGATLYDRELDVTEGRVFVHGLALLRMAELRGLQTDEDYEFMPSLARVPLANGGPGSDFGNSGPSSA